VARIERGVVDRQISALFQTGTAAGLTDGPLPERFVQGRAGDDDGAAELAFTVLVERHGPTVIQVCRRLLGDPHDANDAFQATFLGIRPPQIADGATVRERQLIFKVYDLKVPLRVAAKVPEPIMHRVRQGAPARVRVEALGRTILNGRVERVNPLPDVRWYTDADIAEQARLYTALVPLEKVGQRLRLGMSARVELLLKELANVLTVPIEATLRFDGKDHVAVPRSGGGIDWREVTLGERNNERGEVTEGLESGESVVLSAGKLRHK
jgi:RNA polymerase sigma-70 factor (ECF subfamily)